MTKSKTIWIINSLLFVSNFLNGQSFSGEINPCGNEYLQSTVFSTSPEYNHSILLDTVIYKIPVVFHIQHDGEHSNLSKSDVLYYLSELNERFRRTNADTIDAPTPFLQYGDDTQIEFVIASVDPEGNCTEGIVRYYNPLGWFGSYQDLELWESNQYLNIVIERRHFACNYATSPLPSTSCSFVGGESAFPHLDVYAKNAVWIGYAGRTGEYSSTILPHEVGHWFNLLHPWGAIGGLSPVNTNCLEDDGVDDTPIQYQPNYGCPEFPHYSCDNTAGDLFSNYMDYTYCRNMFTEGQKERMWIALSSGTGGRNNLWVDINLTETGVLNNPFPNGCESKPVADFGFGKYANYWCSGDAIPFWDASWKATPTEWYWTFEGGIPSTSNEQNPFITYEESGMYEVTLISSNNFGSDTLTREVRITVMDEEPKYEFPNLFEDFEESSLNFNEFYLFSDSKSREWNLVDTVSYSGQHSMMLQFAQNYNGTNFVTPNLNGARYAFFTPEFDISQLNSGKLSFYIAATSVNLASSDFSHLGVFASINCSEIDELIQVSYEFNWDSLGTYSGYATPQIADWKKITIDIPEEVFDHEKVSFVFRYNSDYESNDYHRYARIYIDDIRIESSDVVSTKEVNDKYNWQLIPNPTFKDEVTILGKAEGEIIIYDMNGKIIHYQKISGGKKKINLSNFPNGTYFVYFRNETYSDTKKLILIR